MALVDRLDRIHKAGEGVRGENSKSSAMHLVSAVPDPTVRGDDAGIWWGGRDKAVVVVGRLDRKRKAVEGVGGRKLETERDALGFGCAGSNSEGERCRDMVG